ncbi:hypothetical protein Nepgr_020317 [Nepenthes gracilis]|uniref:Uncharacterized protein n=1 Tax=Nepenthes gracilis TaxID=150966 RepID=A0AAD3SX35_NEPGR|nr:hypothetical protein Nepgr_020317 [Nepenthes gracilis]
MVLLMLPTSCFAPVVIVPCCPNCPCIALLLVMDPLPTWREDHFFLLAASTERLLKAAAAKWDVKSTWEDCSGVPSHAAEADADPASVIAKDCCCSRVMGCF